MSDPNTIDTTSTEEERRRQWRNKLRDGRKMVPIDPDQKFAVTLISLNPGVTQPDDYAALKVALLAVPGISAVELLVDGETYTAATVPVGEHLELIATAAVRQKVDAV